MNPFRWLATGPDRPQLADQREIDRLYRRNRLRIMLAITLGYGVVYTCRLALSVVKKPLIDGGIFTADELGLIGSALFYTYAFGKLTNGFLADHANLKLFFSLGVLGSALLNLGMGLSTVLGVSVLLWGLNGWFQGFGAPSGAVAMANWFSNRERGRIYGIWSTAHAIGEGLTFIGVAAVVSAWGWRAGFWGPGLLCIVVAFGLYFLMQDRPKTLGLPSVADWKDDHWSGDSDEARSGSGDLDNAALDPQVAGDLGAGPGERVDLRHPLRDQQLGGSLPAGGEGLHPAPGGRRHLGQHARRNPRRGRLRLRLGQAVQGSSAADESDLRHRRAGGTADDLLRADRQTRHS